MKNKTLILLMVLFCLNFILKAEEHDNIISTCKTMYWYDAYNKLAKEIRKYQLYAGIALVSCSGFVDAQCTPIANFPEIISFRNYKPMQQGQEGKQIYFKETTAPSNMSLQFKYSWDDNDPIWQDMPGGKGAVFDADIDIKLYDGDGSLKDGDKGFCDGSFYFFDNNENNICDNTEELWQDGVKNTNLPALIYSLQYAWITLTNGCAYGDYYYYGYVQGSFYTNLNINNGDFTGLKTIPSFIVWDWFNFKYYPGSVKIFPERSGNAAYQFTIIPTHLADGTKISNKAQYGDYYNSRALFNNHLLPIHFDELRQMLNLNLLKGAVFDNCKLTCLSTTTKRMIFKLGMDFSTLPYQADFYTSQWEGEYLTFKKVGQVNGTGNPKGIYCDFPHLEYEDPRIFKAYVVLKWDFPSIEIPAFDIPVNSTPDLNTDGFINNFVNQESIFNETGTVFHNPESDSPQVILPLRKNGLSTGSFQTYDYLFQGSAKPLPFYAFDDIDYFSGYGFDSQWLSMVSRNKTEFPNIMLHRSLSSHISTDIYLNDSEKNIHVKRLSIIRPHGQMVTFNFPWNATQNKFEDIGIPIGVNKERTYRLIKTDDDLPYFYSSSTLPSYTLQFENGTSHIFFLYEGDAPESFKMMEVNHTSIQGIKRKGSTLLVGYEAQKRTLDDFANYFPIRGFKYDVNFDFNNMGVLAKIVYTPKDGDTDKQIEVELEYDLENPGKIKKLKKTVPFSMAINGQTQYEISIDGDTITYPDGSTSKREQTAPAGQERTVTITKTDSNLGTIISKYFYNASDLLTKTEITANGSTSTTQYTYGDPGTVYPNSTRSEHKLKSIKYPDGSWKFYTYNSNGWLAKEYSPFNNSPAEPGESSNYVEYLYSPHESGDTVNEKMVWEMPRTTIVKKNDKEVSRRYLSYIEKWDGTPSILQNKTCISKNSTWDDSSNLTQMSSLPYKSYFRFGIFPDKFETPISNSNVTYDFSSEGLLVNEGNNWGVNPIFTCLKTVFSNSSANGTGLNEVTTITNPRGIVKSRIVTDGESGEITESAVSQTDSFGRITRTDYLDGTFEKFEDYCLYGPQKITDRLGNTTIRDYWPSGQIKSVTSALAKTEYTYDVLGNTTSRKTTPVIENGGEVISESWNYDAQSRITSHTNSIGTTTYVYNGPDVTITYPDKTKKIIDKNLDGTIASVSGTAVSPVSYDYGVDENKGYWEKTINGNIWSTKYYNMLGKVYRIENSSGYWSETSFDDKGRAVATTDSSGRTSSKVFNEKNEVSQTTVNGVTTDFAYKVENGKHVSSSTLHSSLGDIVSTNTTSIDGKISTSTVNDRTSTSVTEYLGGGETKSSTTGPLNIVTESVVNNISSKTTVKTGDAVLAETQSVNDAHGRTIQNTIPRIGSAQIKYRAGTGQVAETQSPDKQKTEITYKANKFQPDTIKTPYQSVIQPVYDAKGNLTEYSGTAYGLFDASTSYNDQQQVEGLTTKGAPGQAETSWIYDTNSGRLSGKKIGDKQAFNMTYYPDGRVNTLSRGSLTKMFQYTAAPQLFPAGVKYDSSANTPDVIVSGHNTFGQPGKIVTSGICEHSFSYNKDLKITQDNFTSGEVNPRNTKYKYDDSANAHLFRSQMVSGTDSVDYAYDEAQRLKEVSANGISATYSYVPKSPGLVDTVTIKKGDQILLVRDFNYAEKANRVTSLANENGNGKILDSFLYTYHPNTNKISSITRDDGTQYEYKYDPRGQLESEIRKVGAFNLGEYAYSADSITNILAGGLIKFGNQPEFSYTPDIFNALEIKRAGTTIEISGSADKDASITINNEKLDRDGEHESFFCILDANNDDAAVYVPVNIVGALFDPEAVPEVGGDQSGNVPGSDLIQEISGSVFMPKATDKPVYDNLKGHLLEDSGKRCTWDFENRMLSVETKIKNPDGKFVRIENTYDHVGRRIKKAVFKKTNATDNWTPTTDHYFYYDGTQLGGQPADFGVLTGETIINHESAESNELQYLWGLDSNGYYQGLGGIGGLLAVLNKSTGETYLPVMDKKGTVHAYIDADSGKEVAKFAYDPFGGILRTEGEMAKLLSLRYNTKYYDKEVNLYYHETRFYDPATCKWLSRDPIGESGGLNLYAYCNNDPINGVDYLGLAWYNPADDDFFLWEGGAAAAGATNDWVIQPSWTGIKATGETVNEYAIQPVWSVPVGIYDGISDWMSEEIAGVYVIEYDRKARFLYKPILIGDANSKLSTILAHPEAQGVTDIWLNGQSNVGYRSQLLATRHTRFSQTRKAIVIHNPTNARSGGLADTVQTAMGKLIGPSKVSRQVAEILSYRAKDNVNTHLYFHSQGGVMGTNALFYLGIYYGLSNWSNAKVEHHGSASNYYVARLSTLMAGAEWWGMENHSKDAVGNVIGLNSVNPFYILRSIIWAPSLGISSAYDVKIGEGTPGWIPGYGSNHTYYGPMKKEHWSRFFTQPLY